MIDPLQLGRPYYLAPDRAAGGARPYLLLREALTATRRTVVARVALRGRRHHLARRA